MKERCRGRFYGYVLEKENIFVSIDGKTALGVWDENKNFTIPRSITSIDYFYNVSPQTEITIPSSVKTIGIGAFGDDNISKINFESLDINIGFGDSEYIVREYEFGVEKIDKSDERDEQYEINFNSSISEDKYDRDIILNNAIIKIGIDKDVYYFDNNIRYYDSYCLAEGIKELHLPDSIKKFMYRLPKSLEIIEFPKKMYEINIMLCSKDSKLRQIILPENYDCEINIKSECFEFEFELELVYKEKSYIVSTAELKKINPYKQLFLKDLISYLFNEEHFEDEDEEDEEEDSEVESFLKPRDPFYIYSSFVNPFKSVEILETSDEYIFRPVSFFRCNNLSKVIIKEGPCFYRDAFTNCLNLKEVYFNAKIANLNIFNDCSNIESIYFGENVEYIIPSGMSRFPKLKNIQLINNKYLKQMDGVFYKNNVPILDINEKEIIFIFALKNYYETNFSSIKNCGGVIGFDFDEIPNYYLYGLSIDKFEIPMNVKYVGIDSLFKTKEIILYDKNIVSLFCVGNSWGSRYAFFPKGKYIYEAVWNNHLITLKNHHTDKIIFSLYMGCEGETIEIKNIFANSVRRLPNFTFDDIDGIFDDMKKVSNKMLYALYRVKEPYDLTEELESKYRMFLKKRSSKLYELLLEKNMVHLFEYLINNDVFQPKEVDAAKKYINVYMN